MFGKAKVKRFNEEGSCAPAPNAYDAKLKESKSGAALAKSQRFEDSKYITPGPGEYIVPGALGNKPASVKPNLLRSASFRMKKSSLLDLTGCSLASTPCKTPRKLRRSNSFTQLSSSKPTKAEELDRFGTRIVEQENEISELNAKLAALQDAVVVQCEHENITEINSLREKLESVEAELETCKSELSYRTRLVEELEDDKDNLSAKCEGLKEKSDRVESLRDEVDLLNQDNSTLEEELVALRLDRKQAEEELETMRIRRSELEAKSQEDDAKNIFLHFTQEQLNTQVVSLEGVLRSLRQENHLLSQGLKKMVASVQEEKSKNAEITEAYMKENMDAELEFNKLQNDLSKTTEILEKQTFESRTLEGELRAQIGELTCISRDLHGKVSSLDGELVSALRSKDDLMVTRDKLENDLSEAMKDLEVSENDKTVLKDSLKDAEKANSALALDLGQITKSKDANEECVRQLEEDMEAQLQRFEEARSEVHDLEMTRTGLEGVLASLREEMGQLEAGLTLKSQDLEQAENDAVRLNNRIKEREDLLEENKGLITKMEELGEMQQEKVDNLSMLLKNYETEVEDMRSERTNKEKEIADLKGEVEGLTGDLDLAHQEDADKQANIEEMTACLEQMEQKVNQLESELEEKKDSLAELLQSFLSQQQELEVAGEKKSSLEETLSKKDDLNGDLQAKLDELKMSREEIEESLLDTQELVTCMETKLEEAYSQHREEADQLCGEVRSLTVTLENIREERAKLVDINTDLTNQVSESLHAIGALQNREQALGNSCQEYAVQLEVMHEEGERDRIRILQAEEEIASLQGELEASLAEIGDMEAGKIMLRESNQQLENHLDQFKSSYKQVQDELVETKTVGRELYLRVQELEATQQDQEQELNCWKQSSHDKENEIQLLAEKVKHLESLRDNLELNVSEKSDLLTSLRDEMNTIREANKSDQSKHEEISKLNLRLKGNLEVRQEELRSLRAQLETAEAETEGLRHLLTKSEQKQSELETSNMAARNELETKATKLQHKVMEQVEKIADLETDRQEKEHIRMKEMEMLMQLRQKLDATEQQINSMQESVERGESAQRSMEAQQRVLCEAEGRAAASEDAVEKWRQRMEEAELIMKEMERRLEEEEQQNKLLQDMIEPFKDQLESFEIEKNALLSQSEQAQDEVKKLSDQYGKLLGHQNQKQKIQHVVKIKQENVELKSEISTLREQVLKNRKTISRLEDRLQEATGKRGPRLSSIQTPIRNKENSMLSTPMRTPLMGPPVKDSVQKTKTGSRGSVSSPLKDKN